MNTDASPNDRTVCVWLSDSMIEDDNLAFRRNDVVRLAVRQSTGPDDTALDELRGLPEAKDVQYVCAGTPGYASGETILTIQGVVDDIRLAHVLRRYVGKRWHDRAGWVHRYEALPEQTTFTDEDEVIFQRNDFGGYLFTLSRARFRHETWDQEAEDAWQLGGWKPLRALEES